MGGGNRSLVRHYHLSHRCWPHRAHARHHRSKKVQQEHLRNETVLRSIFDSSTDTFLLISPQLRVLAFNRKANLSISQIYGRETFVGDDFRSLIIPGTEGDFYDHFHKALKGEATHVEKDIVMPNNQRRWFRFHYYPVYNHENELIGVSFTAADIHELKSFSELIEENRRPFLRFRSTNRM